MLSPAEGILSLLFSTQVAATALGLVMTSASTPKIKTMDIQRNSTTIASILFTNNTNYSLSIISDQQRLSQSHDHDSSFQIPQAKYEDTTGIKWKAASTSSAAPPTNTSVPPEHPYIIFARSIYSWLVPSMVTILLIAMLGNALIVLSAPWISGEASHYNWLCVSLAAADAWAASLLITGLIVNSYVPVVLGIAWNGKCVAALLEIFRIAGMLTSNLHILALAANQYVGICHPLLHKITITSGRIRMLITLLWAIPIIFVGAWFVSIPGDSLFSDCRHDFYTRLPFRLNIFITFATILLVTMLIYVRILIFLLREKARYKFRRNSVLYSYRRRVKSKMKLLTTTFLILSTFTLSWGVCVLYFVLVCKSGCTFVYLKSISFETGLLLNSSVNFLVALKLVLNPLIYALRMSHIRKSVAALFGAVRWSHSVSSQMLTLRPPSSQFSSLRRPSDAPSRCDRSGSSRELLPLTHSTAHGETGRTTANGGERGTPQRGRRHHSTLGLLTVNDSTYPIITSVDRENRSTRKITAHFL